MSAIKVILEVISDASGKWERYAGPFPSKAAAIRWAKNYIPEATYRTVPVP